SRRRHTRFSRDWSSDVCSSDLREAIKKLNYHPNNIARSLSNKSSNLIAFIVPNLNNPYFTDLINLLDVSAEKHGYKLYLCNSNRSEERRVGKECRSRW